MLFYPKGMFAYKIVVHEGIGIKRNQEIIRILKTVGLTKR